MTDGRRVWSSRQALGMLAVSAGCLLVLWAAASFIDLSDGHTWAHTKRRYAAMLEAQGFDVNDLGFYKVARGQHPREFKTIVVLRGVMPSVFLGVLCVVSALGWSVQPKPIRLGQEKR